jgi:hypothetical protein
LLFVLSLLPLGNATAQDARLAKACKDEILKAEAKIAKARELPEYRSPTGRQVLSVADRWVHMARQHAVKFESRSCVSAAQRSTAQL